MTTYEPIAKRFPELQLTQSKGGAVFVNGIAEAPAAPPFLSQLVVAGETVYLSGQIAVDPATSKMVPTGVAGETEQIFNNIEGALKGIGLTLADVVKVSVYLTNFDEFGKFNEIYIRRMGGCRPAREALGVSKLALGATVEVTMIAYGADSVRMKQR